MLRPDYPIETQRLTLRPLGAGDADAMFAYKSREAVCRYIPHPALSRAQVVERLSDTRSRSTIAEVGDALTLAVVARDSGELIGDVVLFWRSSEHHSGEVGYVFSPEHAGHGYATEATRELLRLGFDATGGLGLHRITARIDARNLASARVAERLGMRREAHLVENEWFKGAWSDELVYALLEDEWLGHGASPVIE